MTIGEVCLLTNDVPKLAAFYMEPQAAGKQCAQPVRPGRRRIFARWIQPDGFGIMS